MEGKVGQSGKVRARQFGSDCGRWLISMTGANLWLCQHCQQCLHSRDRAPAQVCHRNETSEDGSDRKNPLMQMKSAAVTMLLHLTCNESRQQLNCIALATASASLTVVAAGKSKPPHWILLSNSFLVVKYSKLTKIWSSKEKGQTQCINLLVDSLRSSTFLSITNS